MREARFFAVVLTALFVLASMGRAQSKDVFVCPMHPDVVSDKPGKCPECGMNLVKQAAPVGERVGVPGGFYTNVGPAGLKQMLANKDFFFVNVHVPYEGEIEATDAFIPYNEIEKYISRFPADKSAKVFLYCRTGRMSMTAAETLVKLGFSNIWHLKGGMAAWKSAGLPILVKNK